MDFWALNSVTEDPTYLVPLLREMLSRLVGKKIFSELDLVDAYHQIALDEESMECTTFTIPGVGKAFWVVLFFGAKGAVAFFQKIIEGALGEILVDIVIVIYVDNILVMSLEFEQHAREVETVIQALTKVGLRLKPSKCKIGFSSIQFMGAVLDGSKRGIDPHKVKVFALMWRPRTGKEVQKVLGYLNFLRDFIPLYANIVGLMEGLRSAKVILNNLWKESGGEGVFELAKKVLSEAPILHNLDWSLEFFLETDASQYGVGAILYQETEEGKRYVDFKARNIMKYNPHQNGVVERFVAETKRVLMKWLHRDVSGWEYYILAVQMGLNNQILSRHNSCPFSLMFGRRMNGFEEFRDWAHDKVYSEEETEELLKELKTWGEEIWKIVSKESEAIGTRHTECGNKCERNRSRVKNFKVGDLVLKKIINRRNKMGECWEGPFEILAFNKKQKGSPLPR